MRPGFALSLSFDGISLLHRAAGGWRLVGEVGLDTEDLANDLAQLRTDAERLEPGRITCKVIIPNEQIKYLSVPTGDLDRSAREDMVLAALEGATPYAVSDLAFDLSQDGDQTHVAAVARETLDEAETFAVEHGFNPTSFVAVPAENSYLGEPHFGSSQHVGSHQVDPDGIAVVVIGPAIYPQDPPENDETELPKIDTQSDAGSPAPVAESPAPALDSAQTTPAQPATDEPASAPAVGFTSRRKKPDQGAAPSLQGVARTSAAPAPTVAQPVAPPEKPALRPAPTPPPVTPPSVGITSPDLDVPPEVDPKSDAPAQNLSGFHSRRNTPVDMLPAQDSKPKAYPVADAPPGATPRQEATSETERMTLFGARDQIRVGGKPKYLGLVLTAVLVLFLAVIAAWATFFSTGRLGELFEAQPDPATQSPPQVTPDPTETAPVEPAIAPLGEPAEPVAAPAPALPDIANLPAPTEVPLPGLTDTDTAVLDALSDPEQDAQKETLDETPDETLGETATTEQPFQPSANVARYAATGIWADAPTQPETPSVIGLDDLFIASIDRTDLSQDSVALPDAASLNTDISLASVGSPAAQGTSFRLNDQGLVDPTPEGTLSPDGVLVFLGTPPVRPPQTPTRFEEEPETDANRERLAGLRPQLRPEDLTEQAERAQLGGLSRSELAGVRPKLRPESIQRQAEALAQTQPEPETPATPEEATEIVGTKLAVAATVKPRTRPSNMAALVKKASRNDQSQAATIAPATVSPKIPSSASVARQATFQNALNLKQVNLIGVYGSPSDRRALVRLPSGRYKKVKVGDNVDGGKVVAIGDSELRYQKRGRNLTLRIPNG
ncbi:hypothetical protein K3727_13550 [Rhodobacteraceae bacterium M382]|nr:hypothetical protein K3727_13550 [Rhodobacteraceae bacterium M382]